MKREKIDKSVERKIVTGMVVSDQFLRDVKPIYNADYLASDYAKVIGKWCLAYHEKYGKAPLKNIASIFQSEKKKGRLQEADEKLIGGLLSELSDEFAHSKQFNAQYLLDQTVDYFKAQSLRTVADEITVGLDLSNPADAEQALLNYKRVAKPLDTSINPFTDANAIRKAFEQKETPLFTFPGAIGELLNDQLCRDNFIAFLGPEKRGKSFWLFELAFRGYKSRCNVAFFQAGDMGENDAVIRFHIRLSGQSNQSRYCQELRYPVKARPVDKTHNKTLIDGHKVIYETLPARRVLTYSDAIRNGKKMASRTKGKWFKMATYANNTLTPETINEQLDLWEHMDGFVPDVVLVDYADIMVCNKKMEPRHLENEKWKELRSLAQRKHCLVVTATQATRESYDAEVVTAKHNSEDKRKLSHVTAMYGLNQNETEKTAGIMRVNCIAKRDGAFSVMKHAYVLQCLEVGKVCINSYFDRKEESEESDD